MLGEAEATPMADVAKKSVSNSGKTQEILEGAGEA
ncbi:MAG: hypothetical protein ACJAYU_000272 [Bradymonadia bacterium]|jgi:hypothetical protein